MCEQLLVVIPCVHLQDFSEAADALGSLNLSEGWSSLSLRSRHSESGAQDAELRAQRGDPFEDNRSHREAHQEEEEDQYGSAQSVSQYVAPLLWCLRPLHSFKSLSPPADIYGWKYTYQVQFCACFPSDLFCQLDCPEVMLCYVVVHFKLKINACKARLLCY